MKYKENVKFTENIFITNLNEFIFKHNFLYIKEKNVTSNYLRVCLLKTNIYLGYNVKIMIEYQ